MGSSDNKKSEKLENGFWSEIAEAPVDGPRWYYYAVIFHGGSYYYFGGSGGPRTSNSILRLQSGSWTWTNVGQLNSARNAHAVTLVNDTFMVVGGNGVRKNEACQRLNNGQFSCTELFSSLKENYSWYPILFSVADNYGNC